MRHAAVLLGICSMMLFCGCEGILGSVYDEAPEEDSQSSVSSDKNETTDTEGNTVVQVSGQLKIDATSWTDWHYINLAALQRQSTDQSKPTAESNTWLTTMPIPQTLTGEWDGQTTMNRVWFDVFGQGLSNNRIESSTHTDTQAEPEEWTFAIHRENARTNNGEVLETQYTSMGSLPATSKELLGNIAAPVWSKDEMTHTAVWCDQSEMLASYIGCQSISISTAMSGWLHLQIPPVPPIYSLNNHVFLLKLADGTIAALQLENYLSSNGTKCHMTINYKYPY